MRKLWRRESPWMAVIVLALVAGVVFWAPSKPGAKESAGVGWYGYDEGMSKAKESKKPVFMHFYTDWCSWCKKMDRDTFANPKVEEFLNLAFIPIKVNAESKETVKVDGKAMKTSDLARKMGVRGFPTNIFMESDGTTIGSLPGYVDYDRMRRILNYVHEKAYKKMSFEEFTRDRSEFRATGH